MEDHQFPQHLSSPLQFMWWDADTFLVIVIFMTIGMLNGGWAFLAMVVGPILYAQAKKRYTSSFLIHSMYFTGFKRLSHYPSFFENEFTE